MTSQHSLFGRALADALAVLGLDVGEKELALMEAHFRSVTARNATMNLTRIVDDADATVKHYADSLALLAWVRQAGEQPESLLDVGSGAGFPAFPLAIMCPEWNVTVLEAKKKKADFLTESAATLGLRNTRAVHGHSSHWQSTDRFDLVVFRAIGGIDQCLESGKAYVSKAGTIVLYKTEDLPEAERENAAAACRTLRLTGLEPFRYTLPLGDETLRRQLLLFRRGGINHDRK